MGSLNGLLLFCSILLTGCQGAKVRYDGDKVFQVTPESVEELHLLLNFIQRFEAEIDVWKESNEVGQTTDIHVRASNVSTVEKIFTKSGLHYKIMIDNLQQLIEEENDERQSNDKNDESQSNAFAESFNYDAFNSYNDIRDELYRLNQANPSRTKIINVGQTTNKVAMLGIKVFDPNTKGQKKPAIWVDGGIHAREWISPATVMYLLRELIYLKESALQVGRVLSKYDIYLLPVFNIDGYEYSRRVERFWRKTRSYDPYSGCYGVDPNRNWKVGFGGPGTSSNPCRDIYRGKKPFSEPEVNAVAQKLSQIHSTQGLRSYWNLHAYGQFLLYPWSYTGNPSPDDADIRRVSQVFTDNVAKRYGTKYQAGQPSNIMYSVGGGSIDWTYKTLGAKYSFAPELRPLFNRQTRGGSGFLIRSSEIRPTALEFTDGFLMAVLAM